MFVAEKAVLFEGKRPVSENDDGISTDSTANLQAYLIWYLVSPCMILEGWKEDLLMYLNLSVIFSQYLNSLK